MDVFPPCGIIKIILLIYGNIEQKCPYGNSAKKCAKTHTHTFPEVSIQENSLEGALWLVLASAFRGSMSGTQKTTQTTKLLAWGEYFSLGRNMVEFSDMVSCLVSRTMVNTTSFLPT